LGGSIKERALDYFSEIVRKKKAMGCTTSFRGGKN